MSKTDLIFGIHSVKTSLLKTPAQVLELWIDKRRDDKRIAEIHNLVKKAGIKQHEVDKDQLDRMLPGSNHQGIIARCQLPSVGSESELFSIIENLQKPALLLILDGVQDPHNLGACLRCADGAGVDAVVIPKDKSVGITPVVAKVASGALQNTPVIQVTNLARTMERLKKEGVWIVGLDEKGEQTLYEMDLKTAVAFAMGAEGAGLRRLTKEKCDFLVKLPMQGVVESLNVSVASGICLYETLRQRKFA